jgi:hypothetical protein
MPFHRLATDDVTGVLGVGAHGLLEEVVDPLKEIGKGETGGKRLAGLAVIAVGGAGLSGNGSVKDG